MKDPRAKTAVGALASFRDVADSRSRQKDGPSCPGCGLPNWQGLCPHCQGDRQRYEDELVPPFPTTRDEDHE